MKDNQLLWIFAIGLVLFVIFMRCNNRREGLSNNLHATGPGLFQDSQNKLCASYQLQPTLEGAEWPYTPVYYCRNSTGVLPSAY